MALLVTETEGWLGWTIELLNRADNHLDDAGVVMRSSARLCLDTAKTLASQGRETSARKWALRSLQFTIGVLHKEYQDSVQGEARFADTFPELMKEPEPSRIQVKPCSKQPCPNLALTDGRCGAHL